MNTWHIDPDEQWLRDNQKWLVQSNPGAERCGRGLTDGPKEGGGVGLGNGDRCILVAGHLPPHAVFLHQEMPEHLR